MRAYAPKARVVDDNQDAADSLATLLGMMGCETRVAHGGEDALGIATDFLPEVVFLDLGMPGMDGYETCGRLKQLVDAKMIALTGWGQAADRERTKAAGFDHHLVKPATREALKEALQRAAHREAETEVMPRGSGNSREGPAAVGMM